MQQWKRLLRSVRAGRLPSAAVRSGWATPTRPFDLGVHLNLTQGRPLSGSRYPAELLDPSGRFPGVFALFARLRRYGGRFRAAIHAELSGRCKSSAIMACGPRTSTGIIHRMIPAVTEVLAAAVGCVQRTGAVGHVVRTEAQPSPEPNRCVSRTLLGVPVVRVAWEPSLLRSTVLRGLFWRWPLARVKRAFARRFRTPWMVRIAHPDAFYGTVHAGNIDLNLLRLFLAGDRRRAGKRGQSPFVRSTLRAVPANGDCPLFPARLVEVGLHPGEPAGATPPQDSVDGCARSLAHARPDELRMLVSGGSPGPAGDLGWQLGRLAMGSDRD